MANAKSKKIVATAEAAAAKPDPLTLARAARKSRTQAEEIVYRHKAMVRAIQRFANVAAYETPWNRTDGQRQAIASRIQQAAERHIARALRQVEAAQLDSLMDITG